MAHNFKLSTFFHRDNLMALIALVICTYQVSILQREHSHGIVVVLDMVEISAIHMPAVSVCAKRLPGRHWSYQKDCSILWRPLVTADGHLYDHRLPPKACIESL